MALEWRRYDMAMRSLGVTHSWACILAVTPSSCAKVGMLHSESKLLPLTLCDPTPLSICRVFAFPARRHLGVAISGLE